MFDRCALLSDTCSTCIVITMPQVFYIIERLQSRADPSVFDYCNRYRAMYDIRKTRNSKHSDAPAGVDIRTLLCPVKKVCEQPHASTPAVTACAPFRNEREHEDPLYVELLSTEMEFTESCCSHSCEQSLRDSHVHVEISPCPQPATPSTSQAALFVPSQTESVICVHPGQDSNVNNELIEDECID